MPASDRPTPAVALPAAFVVEFTVEPTADVVPPTTLPTVLPAPPSNPPLDEELADVVERDELLEPMSNPSSVLA